MIPALPRVTATDSYGALEGVTTLTFLAAGEGEVSTAGTAGDLIAAYGVDLPVTLRQLRVSGEVGQVRTLTLPPLAGDDRWAHLPTTVKFVGIGGGRSTDELRRAAAGLTRGMTPQETVAVAGFDELDADHAAAFAEGVLLAAYTHPATGTKQRPEPAAQVRLVGAPEASVKQGVRSGLVGVQARTWAATPSNIKNPQWMAEQARAGVRQTQDSIGSARLSIKVHDEKWIAAQGMGGLAAVGGGSATPPRLVVVEYTPKGRTPGEVVVVGKGITYDTGGLNIKPREAMVPMKTDMSGAAVTLAAVLGAARAGAATSIVAVLPFAENAFSGSSYRPSDVLTMFDGTTVEIGNTDAEGRMVLADAMAWARAEYSPELLIDVATLTGAATLGLGKQNAALFSTTAELAQALRASGEATGEPLWRLPLVEEYRHALESPVADLNHIATVPVGAGAITAALFLQHFAGDTPWAHLDIAGPGRAGSTSGIYTEGATGFSARLLAHYLTGDPLAAVE